MRLTLGAVLLVGALAGTGCAGIPLNLPTRQQCATAVPMLVLLLGITVLYFWDRNVVISCGTSTDTLPA